MNLAYTRQMKLAHLKIVSLLVLTSFVLTFAITVSAQQPQLSLADLLIALRSKKVTLLERNAILTEAVKQRGVTFTLTPDIEKELAATGADKGLIDSIRQKIAASKPAPVPIATPIPTPTPPDYSFFQKRGDVNLGKGEFTLALADYNKAVELKADDPVSFLNRGKAHYNLKSFDKSIADYDRSIDLNPKESVAYYNRGVSYEKMDNASKAITDYQRAIQLDPTNELAKSSLKRLQDEEAKALAKAQTTTVPQPAKIPEFLNLGSLSADNATRMVTPVYSPIAQRSNIEGKVTVEVELDEKGNVVQAKATTGHQLLRGSAEDAARKSKFKPAMFGDLALKAKGTINYNFSLKAKS
ncbi:MAG: TonB family protein [Saprospiraceae bacterium]|nr:TonB family protein [Pyrinomonadaceae bacterium]